LGWSRGVRGYNIERDGPVRPIDFWVDERLAFRSHGDTKVTAVRRGEAQYTSLEARAALAGGKVLQDIRMGLRRDEHEFTVTLKGPNVHLTGAKLPQVITEGDDELLLDRMFVYGELNLIVGALFRRFTDERDSDAWRNELLPALQEWVTGDS